jgi:glycosyltransferase involved in cell wall biosynthesis
MRIAILTTDMRESIPDCPDPQPRIGFAPKSLLQGFALLPEVEVHVVSCLKQPLASPEKIAPNIFYHGLVVPRIGWLRTGYQGCIRAVRKKLKEIQPEIVHGQGTERDCAISAAFSGFPNVVTVHGNMKALSKLSHSRFGSFQWLAARLEDFTLPRTDGIVCISDYVYGLVKKYQVPTWKVPNAIQQMFFDFPRTAATITGRPLIVNVGVISERKRQQKILGLLESLRGEGLSFDSLFIGKSGPNSAYADQFQGALKLAERKYDGFKHLSKLDDEHFCRLFDQASAMIHFSSEESFGLTFAEAIARGLYLFASDVGSAREIARGVDRVQIFDQNEWSELRGAMSHWLRSGGPQQARPQSLPQEFIQRYHPASVARRHLEIYREVLKKAEILKS